jgi:hypothetical protein
LGTQIPDFHLHFFYIKKKRWRIEWAGILPLWDIEII